MPKTFTYPHSGLDDFSGFPSVRNEESTEPPRLVYKGKTKDVFEINEDILRLVFSDRVTKNDAGEIDPGGNIQADEQIAGQALSCLSMSAYLFNELRLRSNTLTHMLSYDLEALTMDVRRVETFQPGLEWIARWVCTGSFFRRYDGIIPNIFDGMWFMEPVFEVSLKNDEAGDPMIVPSALAATGIVPNHSLQDLINENLVVMNNLHQIFAERNLDLWDIKIEWGLFNGTPILIDEISPGSCRAFIRGTDKRVKGLELAEYFK